MALLPWFYNHCCLNSFFHLWQCRKRKGHCALQELCGKLSHTVSNTSSRVVQLLVWLCNNSLVFLLFCISVSFFFFLSRGIFVWLFLIYDGFVAVVCIWAFFPPDEKWKLISILNFLYEIKFLLLRKSSHRYYRNTK